MNNKLNNTCIKCESIKHGAEIVKFYKDNGWNTNGIEGIDTNAFYGVFEGIFDCQLIPNISKVISLKQAKELVKDNQYPKVMWVSEVKDFVDAKKRVVIAQKCNKFIAWSNAETLEDAEKQISTWTWCYAKDIESEENPLKARIEKLEIELNEIKKLI